MIDRLRGAIPAAAFLVAYHPLCATRAGQTACQRFYRRRYEDGSIRPEPDFTHPSPGVSSLCRASQFVPRLRPGDFLIYLATSGVPKRRRLSAVLHVYARFTSHFAAAQWYTSEHMRIPPNCVVEGSQALPASRTAHPGWDVRSWDAGYRCRASRVPLFLSCHRLYVELDDPRVADEALRTMWGRMPGLQTPPTIPVGKARGLCARLGVLW